MERRSPLRADPDKQRAWQQRGAQKYAERQRTKTDQERTRRSAPQKRSRNVKPSRNDGPWRAEVLRRYGTVCVSCGDSNHVQADHMMPRSQGGASDPRNGLPLCGEFSRNTPGGCHPAKTAGRILIRPEWLHPEQIEFLAEAGWVAWDADGQPYGRGWKHFAPMVGAGRKKGGDPDGEG